MTDPAYYRVTGAQALELRPAWWDAYEEVRCPTCNGLRRITVVTRASEKVRACPHCRGPESNAGRIMVGEPAESPYAVILDYTGGPS